MSQQRAPSTIPALMPLDPALILSGGLQDRLETDPADDAALRQSIATHGQQVPVLVRPHPEKSGYYQIVYGRRRVLALRDLGRPVLALVCPLDDQALVLAQGQENTARRDLSYIERVNFARQMVAAGYVRKIVCDALSVDKTQISRMLAIADRIPPDLIDHIGAAPGVGRDRWAALASLIDSTDADSADMIAMATLGAAGQGSDARFQAVFDFLSGVKAQRRAAEHAQTHDQHPVYDATGLPLGLVRFDARHVTLRLRLDRTDGFEDWLVENLAGLFQTYQAQRPRPPFTCR